MTEARCWQCEEFRRIFGGKTGGGQSCPKDATVPKRNKIYAYDYACENIKEAVDNV